MGRAIREAGGNRTRTGYDLCWSRLDRLWSIARESPCVSSPVEVVLICSSGALKHQWKSLEYNLGRLSGDPVESGTLAHRTAVADPMQFKSLNQAFGRLEDPLLSIVR
jgi:hypothetical protein